jgi:hypothetical protein
VGVSGVARQAGYTEAGRGGQWQGKSSSRVRGTEGVVAGLRLRLRLRLAGWLVYSIFTGRQAGLEPELVACEARVATSWP